MPHYARLLSVAVLVIFAIGGTVWRWWKPPETVTYEETAWLDAILRDRLRPLREADKFVADPDLDPPYRGPKGPKTKAALAAVVDGVIDDILNEADGPLEASEVAGRLGLAIAAVRRRPAEDATRVHAYLILIWRLIGYRSDTGYFGDGDEEFRVETSSGPRVRSPGLIVRRRRRRPKA